MNMQLILRHCWIYVQLLDVRQALLYEQIRNINMFLFSQLVSTDVCITFGNNSYERCSIG
jgi:hypothetical protein